MVIECDELWSFAGKKTRKQWIWIAMDRESRLVVAMHMGSRGRKEREDFGKICPNLIVSKLYSIRITGKPIVRSYPARDIGPW